VSDNSAAGIIGILVQITVFLIITLVGARSYGLSRGIVYGGIVGIYGYALVVSFLALLCIPWQVANIVITIALGILLVFGPTRSLFAQEFPLVVAAVRRAWAATTIVVGVLIVLVLIAALVSEPSIDGQLYHGPALANLVQTGSLWGWAAPNQYLYYSDISVVGGANLATFAGNARFDNALQVPHLLLLIVLIAWVLGRRFSSPFLRVSLATLIVSAPVIWLQPRILYVDVAYAAAVVAAAFFIVFVREYRRFDVLVAGIAVAAVFATKPTGVLTGLILLIALVVTVVLRRRGSAPLGATVGLLASSVLPPLVLGTSFYVRNLVQFGNPVYPIKVEFGSLKLPGVIDLSIFASGERGSGFVDPGRWISYASSIGYGMIHGVTKLDYDPRVGGFGYVPLFVLFVVVALIVLRVVVRPRARGGEQPILPHWRVLVGLVALAAAILLVQPSTFDARYVIGPTVILLTALLLTAVFAVPKGTQLVAGVLALLIAGGQVVWTERWMYPGIKSIVDIMRGPAQWQPNTPANPGGHGPQVAWLPDRTDACVAIALQTAGGVTASGMNESSYLATLSYGLYGDQLCNRVLPVTLNDDIDDTAAILGSDYVVLYEDDVRSWEHRIPELADCLSFGHMIEGSETYPANEIAFRNTCA
jgi:hypothetical protein